MGSDEEGLSTEGSSDEDESNIDGRNHHRYQNRNRQGSGLRGRGTLSADYENRWKPPKGYSRGYKDTDLNDDDRGGRVRRSGVALDPSSGNHRDSFVDTSSATSIIDDSSGGLRPRSIMREIPPHRGPSRRAVGVGGPDGGGGGGGGEEGGGGAGGEAGGASGNGGSLLDVLKPFYMSLKFW